MGNSERKEKSTGEFLEFLWNSWNFCGIPGEFSLGGAGILGGISGIFWEFSDSLENCFKATEIP